MRIVTDFKPEWILGKTLRKSTYKGDDIRHIRAVKGNDVYWGRPEGKTRKQPKQLTSFLEWAKNAEEIETDSSNQFNFHKRKKKAKLLLGEAQRVLSYCHYNFSPEFDLDTACEKAKVSIKLKQSLEKSYNNRLEYIV